MGVITIKLTPRQARILFEVVDGAADAGACDGGLTAIEQRALAGITVKLLATRASWTRPPLSTTGRGSDAP